MAVIIEFGPDFSAVIVEMDVSVHEANHDQFFHHQLIFKREMVETADEATLLKLDLTHKLTILI